jgi:hypothetical protein
MKEKIVGIFVCMLMIATAIPAVTSVKISTINATVPSTPLASMAGGWTEEQKLLASDGGSANVFGSSVSLDGDTALIGANGDDDNGHWSGSAYVFTRIGTTWTQQQKLLPSDGAAEDQFGCFVSLSGDTALIGAPFDGDNGDFSGSAYVFTRTGTTWTQQAKLTAPDGGVNDWFGYCVSLVGDTALIGAQGDVNGGDSGSAYVFTRSGTTWTLQQTLLASDGAAGDCFGYMVSLSGDTALIGADYDDDNGENSGSAYVFTRTGTTWTQQAKLLALDGAAGDDFSGGGVMLWGDIALIGAELDDDNGVDSGSAYIFTRTGTTWTQQAKLTPSDGAAYDQFSCYGLSLDNDTAIIGAYMDDDNGVNSGSAYIFTRTGTTWTQQQKLTASDGAGGDQFGVAVDFDGDTAIIGAWHDGDNGSNSGSAYVFTKENQPPVDVPVWKVGDSWTYNEQYINHLYTANGTLAMLWYHNCTSTYTVTDTTGDNYTVKMTSTNNEGSQINGWLRLKYTPFTKLTGEFLFRKTDLAYMRESTTEKGFVIWRIGKIGLPLPAQFRDTWGDSYTPAGIVFPFPLTAGTSGTLANNSWAGHEKSSLYWGLIKIIDSDYSGYSGEQIYTCEMANISVPAGTYDAYNVSVESTNGLGHSSSWSYYAPEAGWFVKQYIYDENENGKPGFGFECELVSTTYTP